MANKLRAQHQDTMVGSLLTKEGGLIEGDGPVAARFGEFYKDLYSAQAIPNLNIAHYLGGSKVICLTEDQATRLDSPIRKEEVISAIFKQKPLKSSGPDIFR